MKKETAEEILKQLGISSDEKEFITEPNELHAYEVPVEMRKAVFTLLQSGGFTGRHRRRRTRRFRARVGRDRVRSLNSRRATQGRAGLAGRSAGRGWHCAATDQPY